MKHYSEADIIADMEKDQREWEDRQEEMRNGICGIFPDKSVVECAPPVPGIGNVNYCGMCGKEVN